MAEAREDCLCIKVPLFFNDCMTVKLLHQSLASVMACLRIVGREVPWGLANRLYKLAGRHTRVTCVSHFPDYMFVVRWCLRI